jgi:hypothetical protein
MVDSLFLSFIILMGPGRRQFQQFVRVRWASFVLNTEKLYPNVSHQIAPRLYIGIWRCILIRFCVCIKLYTSTYIAKNRYGLPRRREYLVGVNSFSQFWSVLSPSLRLVWSSSGPSFPGSPFLSTNVWERVWADRRD